MSLSYTPVLPYILNIHRIEQLLFTLLKDEPKHMPHEDIKI